MLYEYARYKGYDVTKAADLSGFADQGSVSAFAVGPMQWAVAHELIFGVGGMPSRRRPRPRAPSLPRCCTASAKRSPERTAQTLVPGTGRIHPDEPLFLCYAQEILHFPCEFLNI